MIAAALAGWLLAACFAAAVVGRAISHTDQLQLHR